MFWVRRIRLETGVPKPFQLTSGVPMHLRTVPKRDDGRGRGLRDDVTHSVMTSQDDVGRMGMLHFRKAPFKTVTGHIRILDGMRTDPSYGTHTSQIGQCEMKGLFFNIGGSPSQRVSAAAMNV